MDCTLTQEESSQLSDIQAMLESSDGDAASPERTLLRSLAQGFEKRAANASKAASQRASKGVKKQAKAASGSHS